MATKWADYLISAVQYSITAGHISKVRLHPDNGETVGVGIEVQREAVVNAIESGTTVMTITWNALNKSWTRGAKVETISVAGEKFIRTDRDATKSDNLGQLPTF